MDQDIQARLRSLADNTEFGGTFPPHQETLREAADEIDLLRKALTEIAKVGRNSESKLVQAIHKVANAALYGE